MVLIGMSLAAAPAVAGDGKSCDSGYSNSDSHYGPKRNDGADCWTGGEDHPYVRSVIFKSMGDWWEFGTYSAPSTTIETLTEIIKDKLNEKNIGTSIPDNFSWHRENTYGGGYPAYNCLNHFEGDDETNGNKIKACQYQKTGENAFLLVGFFYGDPDDDINIDNMFFKEREGSNDESWTVMNFMLWPIDASYKQEDIKWDEPVIVNRVDFTDEGGETQTGMHSGDIPVADNRPAPEGIYFFAITGYMEYYNDWEDNKETHSVSIPTGDAVIVNRYMQPSYVNNSLGNDKVDSVPDYCQAADGVWNDHVGACCGEYGGVDSQTKEVDGITFVCHGGGDKKWYPDSAMMCEESVSSHSGSPYLESADETSSSPVSEEGSFSDGSNNGSDGCCGDDDELCVVKDPSYGDSCSDFYGDQKYCEAVGCTFEGYAGDSISCSKVSGLGACNETRLETHLGSDWSDYCDTTNHVIYKTCDGHIPCGEFEDPEDFGDYGLFGIIDGCDQVCSGSNPEFPCESFDKQQCNEYSDICSWEGDDSDYGYVSRDALQFCNKDYSDSTVDHLSFADESSWNWWGVSDANVGFRIHEGLERDFVSNRQEWAVCDASVQYFGDATRTISGNGRPICDSHDSLRQFCAENGFSSVGSYSVSDYDQVPCASYDGSGWVSGSDHAVLDVTCGSPDYSGHAEEVNRFESLPRSELAGVQDSICPLNPADGVESSELPVLDSLPGYDGWSNYVFYGTGERSECVDLADETELISGILDEYLGEEDSSDIKDRIQGCCYHPDISSDHDYSEFLKLDPTFSDKCSELECWPLADYQGDDGPGGSDSGGGDTIPQDPTPPRGYDFNQDCDALSTTYDVPTQTCNDGEVCVATVSDLGFMVQSDCCFGGYCEPDPGQRSCAELSGANEPILIPEDKYDVVSTCVGEEVESSDDGVCCLGERGAVTDTTVAPDDSQAFICYQDLDGHSTFAECCYEGACLNGRRWSDEEVDNGRVFGSGSRLHTIMSFDAYKPADRGNISNHMRAREVVVAKDSEKVSRYLGLVPDAFETPWQEGDVISFDIYYDGGVYQPREIVFDYEDDDVAFDFSDSLVLDRMTPNMWHHVSVELDKEYTPPEGLLIRVHNTTPISDNNVGWETNVYVDNVILERSGFENRYCAGPYRRWLEDLEAEDDDDDGLNESDIAPEREACNAQLSAGWTGTSCCGRSFDGRASVTPDDTDYSAGEFYLDTQGVCWGGVPVREDTPVYQAYGGGGRYWSHLLFKTVDGERKMWSCGDGSFQEYSAYGFEPGDGRSFSIEASGGNDAFVTDRDIPVEGVDHFSIVGHWYCDPSDQWKPLGSVARVKALATKLYEMSGDTYSLHCDYYNLSSSVMESSSLAALDSPIGSPSDDAVHACVLRNETSEGQLVYLAIPLDMDEAVDDFVSSLYKSYFPLNSSDAMPDCDRTAEGGSMPDSVVLQGDSSDDFFTPCQGSGSTSVGGLHVSYNKPLNMVLLSQDEPPTPGFFARVWAAVKDFFAGMFIGSGESPNQAGPVTLPFTALQGDFTHLYLAENGSKRIRGIMEHRDYETIPGKPSWFVRVDYENFSRSVEPLVEGYAAAGLSPSAAKRCSSGPNQTIFLQFPGDEAEGFDWRYLTSNIRLDGTGGAGSFTSDASCWLHNGVLDPGEECDDTLKPDEFGRIIVPSEDGGWPKSFYCPAGGPKACVDGVVDDYVCGLDHYVLYFTSNSFNGDLDGLTGADERCRQAAESGLFSKDVDVGAALAVVSSSGMGGVDVQDRFQSDVPVWAHTSAADDPLAEASVTVADLFPDSGSGFRSGSQFLFDEFGDSPPSSTLYWTGSRPTGVASGDDCAGWTSAAVPDRGTWGSSDFTIAGRWLLDSASGCDSERHLLCMVPASDG